MVPYVNAVPGTSTMSHVTGEEGMVECPIAGTPGPHMFYWQNTSSLEKWVWLSSWVCTQLCHSAFYQNERLHLESSTASLSLSLSPAVSLMMRVWGAVCLLMDRAGWICPELSPRTVSCLPVWEWMLQGTQPEH